jgi:hypothetical protein
VATCLLLLPAAEADGLGLEGGVVGKGSADDLFATLMSWLCDVMHCPFAIQS